MNKELILEAKNAIITKVKENKKSSIIIGTAMLGAYVFFFSFTGSDKPDESESILPEMSFRDQLREQNLIDALANCNATLSEAYELPQSYLLKCDDFAGEANIMASRWKVRTRLIDEMLNVKQNLKRFINRD